MLTEKQKQLLNTFYVETELYLPSNVLKQAIADELNVPVQSICYWFAKRRQDERNATYFQQGVSLVLLTSSKQENDKIEHFIHAIVQRLSVYNNNNNNNNAGDEKQEDEHEHHHHRRKLKRKRKQRKQDKQEINEPINEPISDNNIISQQNQSQPSQIIQTSMSNHYFLYLYWYYYFYLHDMYYWFVFTYTYNCYIHRNFLINTNPVSVTIDTIDQEEKYNDDDEKEEEKEEENTDDYNRNINGSQSQSQSQLLPLTKIEFIFINRDIEIEEEEKNEEVEITTEIVDVELDDDDDDGGEHKKKRRRVNSKKKQDSKKAKTKTKTKTKRQPWFQKKTCRLARASSTFTNRVAYNLINKYLLSWIIEQWIGPFVSEPTLLFHPILGGSMYRLWTKYIPDVWKQSNMVQPQVISYFPSTFFQHTLHIHHIRKTLFEQMFTWHQQQMVSNQTSPYLTIQQCQESTWFSNSFTQIKQHNANWLHQRLQSQEPLHPSWLQLLFDNTRLEKKDPFCILNQLRILVQLNEMCTDTLLELVITLIHQLYPLFCNHHQQSPKGKSQINRVRQQLRMICKQWYEQECTTLQQQKLSQMWNLWLDWLYYTQQYVQQFIYDTVIMTTEEEEEEIHVFFELLTRYKRKQQQQQPQQVVVVTVTTTTTRETQICEAESKEEEEEEEKEESMILLQQKMKEVGQLLLLTCSRTNTA